MSEEPSLACAEFAAQRESSMLRSRKSASPPTRMVPESSKIPPRDSSDEETQDVTPEQAVETTTTDYASTCDSILIALRHVQGNITWSAAQRTEAAKIVGCPASNTASNIVIRILCVIIGILLAMGYYNIARQRT